MTRTALLLVVVVICALACVFVVFPSWSPIAGAPTLPLDVGSVLLALVVAIVARRQSSR